MAATAIIEAGFVYLLQPLPTKTLVAKTSKRQKWIPVAFMAIFFCEALSGFATEASLGWIGRSVISDLRRQVFNKFLDLPIRFFDAQAAGPLLSRLTYNVEMVAESVTSVVTIAVRDTLTVIAALASCLTSAHADRFHRSAVSDRRGAGAACSVSLSALQRTNSGFGRRGDAGYRRDYPR